MEEHNFKTDALVFLGLFVFFVLVIPAFAWLPLVLLIAAIYFYFKQRNENHDR